MMKSASRVGSFFSFKIVDYPNIGMSTPNCPPYISQGADKENLLNNHELYMVIISCIFVTSISDSEVNL